MGSIDGYVFTTLVFKINLSVYIAGINIYIVFRSDTCYELCATCTVCAARTSYLLRSVRILNTI